MVTAIVQRSIDSAAWSTGLGLRFRYVPVLLLAGLSITPIPNRAAQSHDRADSDRLQQLHFTFDSPEWKQVSAFAMMTTEYLSWF